MATVPMTAQTLTPSRMAFVDEEEYQRYLKNKNNPSAVFKIKKGMLPGQVSRGSCIPFGNFSRHKVKNAIPSLNNNYDKDGNRLDR